MLRIVTAYFIGFFEHSEDKHHSKSANHRSGVFGWELHTGENRNDQKVNICSTFELKQQTQRSPRKKRILGCTNVVGLLQLLTRLGTLFGTKVYCDFSFACMWFKKLRFIWGSKQVLWWSIHSNLAWTFRYISRYYSFLRSNITVISLIQSIILRWC